MNFFPRTRKAAGWLSLHLSEDGVYAAHVRRLPTEKPVVEFAAFYPSDKASMAQVLGKVAKDIRAERFQCTTLLSPGEYQLLSVDAPNVPPDELKTAIRWRLKDMLDFHVDDATIDVLDVPLDKNATGRPRSMYAAAARNQLIGQQQALFQDAKIPLSVIDLPELSQRNISALYAEEGRGIAMLSFGPAGGLLTVTYSGELYLARWIDTTLAQLQQADSAQKNVLFERLTLELQRSMDHFDRQYHFISIPKLILAPLGYLGPALQDYLSTNLYVPVESTDLQHVFDVSKVPELKEPVSQQKFFFALGAALRQEEKTL